MVWVKAMHDIPNPYLTFLNFNYLNGFPIADKHTFIFLLRLSAMQNPFELLT